MVGKMGGGMPSGASDAEHKLAMLAAVVADPQAFAKRVQEYSAARVACEQQAKESAERLKAAEVAEGKLKAAVSEFEQCVTAEKAALDERREALDQDAAALTDAGARLRAEQLAAEKDANERTAVLDSRQTKLAAREESVKAREDEVTQREAEADQAKATFEAERAAFVDKRKRLQEAMQ